MASPSFTCVLLQFLLSTILPFPLPVLSYVNPNARLHHVQKLEPSSRYRVHIVLVEPPPETDTPHHHWQSFLPTTLTDSGEQRLVHSYTAVFSGFAARLTDSELDAVTKKPGFVRAFPDRTLQLATTHTPAFLGLTRGAGAAGFWNSSGYGKGVIVGLLDSGIHAAHPSFDDHGVPPPPARWKGSCAPGSAVRCNNKLIGARSFVGGGDDGGGGVSDDAGHGTHTSSTAAGNFVDGASRDGLAAGTAAGIAPGAHVAMYKVCVLEGCDSSAILAGLDAAIKDGVDVLSISLGGSLSFEFDHDPIAVGAFSAVSKGVVVVCAAGNNGPAPSSVVNDAPWILTVAAGSVDRAFQADVELVNNGHHHHVAGEALTQGKSSKKQYPLLFSERRRHCLYGDNSSSIVAGKILVCEATDLPTEMSNIRDLLSAGAAGVVLTNSNTSGYTIVVRDYGPGVVQVSTAAGVNITHYATSTSTRRRSSSAAAAFFTFNSTVLGARPSPTVASFSGRGPSAVTPGVLKPDILAPGLNILAAWPPALSETETTSSSSGGSGRFNIISGTSMATPHISGVVALVRSVHPDWSPAAIKSAILTTSDEADSNGGAILDEQHGKAGGHATGAGHVNPTRAADPGLVYDIGVPEYAAYLCALLGDRGQATVVRNASLSCSKLPRTPEAQLNYPTITVPLQTTPFTVNRTVTNVGPAASTYTAKVDVPAGSSLKVQVSPATLVFSEAGEKKTFSVTVSGQATAGQDDVVVQGSLRWVSGKIVVRSPVLAVAGLNRS
ncbi:subtilisin-like protease SBT1.7 [Sorghum bicolor]|uniref:Subtilisin-like protease n=1 Tax=Sorghum bicolor TaxID=4558 RepID=C5WPV2_SORBI|nr:subtilisin-like protease SBT1.7 [Sorghum bicolor]EER91799.1 hypothetical protein SORBI_3001G274100 [Sorghum bicolor]|eukprot:XP_002464801.1 subtilisin-like protease SBT1.7 [Sorghum bicolor]